MSDEGEEEFWDNKAELLRRIANGDFEGISEAFIRWAIDNKYLKADRKTLTDDGKALIGPEPGFSGLRKGM